MNYWNISEGHIYLQLEICEEMKRGKYIKWEKDELENHLINKLSMVEGIPILRKQLELAVQKYMRGDVICDYYRFNRQIVRDDKLVTVAVYLEKSELEQIIKAVYNMERVKLEEQFNEAKANATLSNVASLNTCLEIYKMAEELCDAIRQASLRIKWHPLVLFRDRDGLKKGLEQQLKDDEDFKIIIKEL